MKKIMLFLLLLCSLLIAISPAMADGENKSKIKEGLYLNTNLGGSVNQLGLALKAELFYRFPLVDSSGLLWKNTKVELGVQEYLSPTFQRISAYFMIEPIAFFDVKAYVGYDYMYDLDNDTFGSGFIAFPSVNSEYDTDFRKLEDGVAKGGFRMLVVPTLKMAVGPIAALYSLNIEYHNYDHDGYYYDYGSFLLNKGEDTVLKHDVKLLYRTGDFSGVGKFMFGASYTNNWVRSSEKTAQKIVGMVVYLPKWSIQGERLQPYFVTQMGSHVQDRYYKGKFYFALLMGMSYRLTN